MYGKDAARFEQEKKRVDNMDPEERKANKENLRLKYEEFCRKWNLTVKI